MNTLSYKTVSLNKETAKKEWVVIDCTDQVVGRLCSKVAKILRGKYKPTFTPHADCGDNVILINASKARRKPIRFTLVTLVTQVVSVSTPLLSSALRTTVSTRCSVTQ